MKNIISQMLWRSGLTQKMIAKAAGDYFFVVNYHRVCPKEHQGIDFPEFFDLRTSPALFAKHLAFFKEQFHMASLDHIFDAPSQKPKLLITFDDGYRDNHDFAFPLLKEFGVPALFFVATEVLEAKRLLWDNQFFYTLTHVGLTRTQEFFSGIFPDTNLNGADANQVCRILFHCFAKKILSQAHRMQLIEEFARTTNTVAPQPFVDQFYLRPSQISVMANEGMAFGAHTHHHALLPTSTDAEVVNELTQSKNLLESVVGKNVLSFCYPSGQVSAKVTNAVSQHFSIAFTTQEHRNSLAQNPLLLGRFNVSTQSPPYLAFELSGCKNKIKSFMA